MLTESEPHYRQPLLKTPFHEQFSTEEQMKAMVSNIPQGRAGGLH